jgi:hypothetical protein
MVKNKPIIYYSLSSNLIYSIIFLSLIYCIYFSLPSYHLHVYSSLSPPRLPLSLSLIVTFSILSLHLEGCKRKIGGERDVNLEKIREELLSSMSSNLIYSSIFLSHLLHLFLSSFLSPPRLLFFITSTFTLFSLSLSLLLFLVFCHCI